MNLRGYLSLPLLFLVSGCASLGVSRPAEVVVEQRANQYMNAFLANDFRKAYTFMTPGYRDTHTYEIFASDHIGMVDLVSFEVTAVVCEEDRCDVTIDRKQKALQGVLGSSKKPMVLPMVTRQVWMLVDGKWYRYKR